MTTKKDDVERLLTYMKCLGMLRKEDNHYIRSILQAFNLEHAEKFKPVRQPQDLAELMLDQKVFSRVIHYAEELLPSKTYKQLRLCLNGGVEGDELIPRAKVEEYKVGLQSYRLYRPDATLKDLSDFIINATPAERYFIVIGEGTNELLGIVSINDYRRNAEKINKMLKEGQSTTLVVDLDFFNSKPTTIQSNDTMEKAFEIFTSVDRAGKKINAILVVDDKKNMVGLLWEHGIGKWQAHGMP